MRKQYVNLPTVIVEKVDNGSCWRIIQVIELEDGSETDQLSLVQFKKWTFTKMTPLQF